MEAYVSRKRRAPAGAKKQQNMKTFYIVLAGIAVVGVGAIVYSMNRSGGTMATEPLDMSQVADADALLAQAQGIVIGEPDAPVKVIVFSDFQCGGCGYWAGSVEPHVKQQFVEAGKVQYTYYDFPLVSIHAHAFLAARAGRCANDQGRFWDYHDRVFAGQNSWAFSRTAPVGEFTQYATDVGLDVGTFSSCLNSNRHADVVTANQLLGEQLGVRATPTVFVGPRRLGDEWQDVNAVSAAIEAAGGV
jgi:protein-disulfide isomerase